ncbi:MAG: hypothetical protein AB8U25_05910 [Rickettsiales endosymbiont of Dermacentor nuttalli]
MLVHGKTADNDLIDGLIPVNASTNKIRTRSEIDIKNSNKRMNNEAIERTNTKMEELQNKFTQVSS